jgi:YfiH family protein
MFEPAWPAPERVGALMTTRQGGVSSGPYGAGPGSGTGACADSPGGGLNLAQGEDDPAAVERNRAILRARLPSDPAWLTQVHGIDVVDATAGASRRAATPRADASFATRPGVVCAVLVADCLPVLLADVGGRGVAAAHAGWRGLAGGVLQAAVQSLREAIGDPGANLLAWLGPAIGPAHFEVGGEVREAMLATLPDAGEAFSPGQGDRLQADLFALARQALAQAGVHDVHGGGTSTVAEPGRFFSYRRDQGRTGRQAALVWLRPDA